MEKQVADVARAVRWVWDHADQLGVDRGKIHLLGHSAGAHLAMLAAADPAVLGRVGLSPAAVGGVCGLSGPYSVELMLREMSPVRTGPLAVAV